MTEMKDLEPFALLAISILMTICSGLMLYIVKDLKTQFNKRLDDFSRRMENHVHDLRNQLHEATVKLAAIEAVGNYRQQHEMGGD